MFFGTSILEAFGLGFGSALGVKNQILDFRIFVRYFFEANFQGFLGRLKNQLLKVQHWKLPHFWAGPAECA